MKFDHVLLIGYGGPRKPGEVMPFLKGMTGGRNIPEESLKAVARNYEAIGGASPYHDEVTDFAGRLSGMLRGAGMDLPVFIGMKNWHPFLSEVLPDIRQGGHQKGIAVILNAFPGAAAGARYQESLKAAQVPGLEYTLVEGWYCRELFIEAQAEEAEKSLRVISAGERSATPILFTFHSLPVAAGGSRYTEEARETSALVAKRLGHAKWSVVYQSKPLGAKESWLGPDINEAIGQLAKDGEKRVVIVPLGFFCDHVEILYDLDRKARETAGKARLEYLRAETVIHNPRILELFKELITGAREKAEEA